MAERKQRKPIKKRPSKNEFEEIIEKKLKKEPIINRDDILDFKIDFGLYNQKIEKFLAEEKKNLPETKQGKKRWVKRKRIARKSQKVSVKKYMHILQNTNKNLELKAITTK